MQMHYNVLLCKGNCAVVRFVKQILKQSRGFQVNEASDVIDHVLLAKRSGYCRNLGSLRAGTRHHGDFSVMGTSSLQPFLKSYWLTPVK